MPSIPSPPEAVYQQLERILASEGFRNASQSSRLLRFLVGAVVEGREDLKEYTLGSEALGRGEKFDPRVDPIARVEASRLRSRLDQYYSTEGREDTIVLRLPKGTYVPQVEIRRTPQIAKSPQRRAASRWVFGIAAVISIVGGAIFWRAERNRAPASKQLVRLDVDLEQGDAIGTQVGSASAVLSPDGRKVVYISVSSSPLPRLFLRRLDQTEASGSVELPGTEGARGPFFSPDGEWVAFWASGKLKKIRLDGGTPVDVCHVSDLLGGSWGDDNNIVGSSGRELWIVPASGGSPKSLAKDLVGLWPEQVPGFPVLLYTTGTLNHDIAAFSPRDGRRRVLVRSGTYPRYLPDSYGSGGYLLYLNSGTLFGIRFDPRRIEVEGNAAAILHNVSYSDTFGSAQLDVSREGTLLYRGASANGQFTIQWLNAKGELTPLLAKPDAYSWPKLSPDGTRLTFVLERGDSHDVWTYDAKLQQLAKLNSTASNALSPQWTPDGKFIVSGVPGQGLMVASAAGSGKEHFATNHEWLQVPGGFSPDGKHLALHQRVSGPFQIWIAPVQEENDSLLIGAPQPFHESDTFETYGSFAPDGRWIAYTSLESGTYEVYVRAFPDNGAVRRVSAGGGTQGIWAGRKLFYRANDNRIMVVTYRMVAGKFVPDQPRPWTDVRVGDTGVLPNFDVSADGEHVAVLMPVAKRSEEGRTRVTFLLHFSDLLRERLPQR